jgi:hypothetical protein
MFFVSLSIWLFMHDLESTLVDETTVGSSGNRAHTPDRARWGLPIHLADKTTPDASNGDPDACGDVR